MKIWTDADAGQRDEAEARIVHLAREQRRQLAPDLVRDAIGA